MNSKSGLKAAIAFVAWIGVALIFGFLVRDSITRVLGPEVWLGAALWAGSILGLMNVLGVLIISRR
jgi:hypothetical protein